MKIYSLLLIFALLTYINNTDYCGDEETTPSSANDCKNREIDSDDKEEGADACCFYKATLLVETKECMAVKKSEVKDAVKEMKDAGLKDVSIEYTELLSSANNLLSKQNNVHNDYFQNEFLETCYNHLL